MNALSQALSNAPSYVWWMLVAWSIVWKGLALWKSARKSDKVWFVCILVINSVGILEIIYLTFFEKRKSVKRK